jgi:hypothetical protein
MLKVDSEGLGLANMACRYVFSISITVVSSHADHVLEKYDTNHSLVQQMDVPRRGRQEKDCLPLPSIHDVYTHGGAILSSIARPIFPPSHATWTRLQ